MKVLHVINSLVSGGAEKLVSELTTAQANFVEVGLFTFVSTNDLFTDNVSKKVAYYPQSGKGYFKFRKVRALAKAIKNYDVIHVHLFPALYLVAFISFIYPNKIYVLTEHNTVNQRRKPIFYLIEKIVYSRFSNIICISKAVENELGKWIRNLPTTIIKNFVDLHSIVSTKPLKKDTFVNTNSKLLIMIGSFTSQKDQKTLIKSLSVLNPDYELLLIGEGPLKEDMVAFAKNEKVLERVHFLGTRKDVIPILKACDYGVLSSHWEGFGIVALEYMASNIISLGTNVDGLNEVIPIKENLFTQGDYNALATRIKEIEIDSNLKNHILDVQKRTIASYDISQSVELHLELYKSLKEEI